MYAEEPGLRVVPTSPNEWARAPRLRSHTDTLPLSVPKAIIPREVGLDAPELPRFDCRMIYVERRDSEAGEEAGRQMQAAGGGGAEGAARSA